MCGIAGIVWKDRQRPVERALLEAMTEALSHRGPDGSGLHLEAGAGLGHRRLSVIDLEGGKQPLANEDETVWVTFNGEIYNFAALGEELRGRGHVFKTQSDTEVLVHLWEEDGPRMVERLRGMFALALWDGRDGTLFLARDRLGKKPLVYWLDEEGIRFASELKGLARDPKFPRVVDPIALDEYLTYQYVPAPRTIYQGAKKLPPAHYGVYQRGRWRVERYWRPAFEVETKGTWEEDKERVRKALIEATRLRMVSDVPLGAFLSGGIDSTIIVGIMQSLSSQPVRTFSVGFPVPEYDETRFARLAAEHLGTEHHELRVEPDGAYAAEKLAHYFDEPFGDSSAIPTYYLSEATRRSVTVALTGDGGDELFLGYDRYEAVRLSGIYDRLPGVLQWPMRFPWWRALPAPGRQKSWRRKLKRMLEALELPAERRYAELVTIFGPRQRAGLYTEEFQRELADHDARGWIAELYGELPGRDFLTRTSYVDVHSYLPGDILTKVDMASMAHGLECRSPMLDHHFVDLVAGLAVDRKLGSGGRKILLKEAFGEHLPGEIKRRGKMGFGVPLDHWFRRELVPLVEEVLLSGRLEERGWFRGEAVRQIVQEHQRGAWDHSARLWALLMLELWGRNYLDRR